MPKHSVLAIHILELFGYVTSGTVHVPEQSIISLPRLLSLEADRGGGIKLWTFFGYITASESIDPDQVDSASTTYHLTAKQI